MCAPVIKFTFLFFALFLFGLLPSAQAKKFNFANTTGVGLYFKGGASQNPKNDFATSASPDAARDYSLFFAFEPGVDFGNFGLRGNFTTHVIPNTSGSSTDTILSKNYEESSELSLKSYGLSILFFPHYAQGARSRIYFGLGAGLASAEVKNTRSYLNATGTITATNEVRGDASSEYLQGFLGFEFFVVQNYTLQFEAGYRDLSFGEFEYKSSTSIQGTTVVPGATILSPRGATQAITMQGLYFATSFGLHF